MKTTLLTVCLLLNIAVHSQTAVFPLRAGDRWVFTGPLFGTPQRVIGDTVFPNGLRYSIVSWTIGAPLFQRQSGNQVFQYDTQRQREDLWFDFARNPRDTINSIVRGNDTTDITMITYRLVNAFGRNRREWGFHINYSRRLVDDERSFLILDSLGIWDITGAFGFATLYSAVINGVQYTTTDVRNEIETSLPSFHLRQNYPNPFNPSTFIAFTIPPSYANSNVELTIYDVQGQRVQTLVKNTMPAGNFVARWDGTNERGNEVASGVYLCKLSSGRFSTARKLVLAK
jgi:hypothetical protein